jgi:hypothetical protein
MSSDEAHALNLQVFREDTEAGRLLRRLYGVERHTTKVIAYPKLKVRRNSISTDSNRPNWNLSYNNRERIEVSDKKICVPKVGSSIRNNNQKNDIHSKLDVIPRRKTYESCVQTIHDLKTFSKAYRPPNQKFIATEDEKIKLAQIFENSNVEGKQAEHSRELCNTTTTQNSLTGPSASEMANLIYQEIKERRQFQDEMESFDEKYSKNRNAMAADIGNRLNELMKYDKALAKKLLEELNY